MSRADAVALKEEREQRAAERRKTAAEVVRLNSEDVQNPTIARRLDIGLRTVERILQRYRIARAHELDHDDAVLWAAIDRRSEEERPLGETPSAEG